MTIFEEKLKKELANNGIVDIEKFCKTNCDFTILKVIDLNHRVTEKVAKKLEGYTGKSYKFWLKLKSDSDKKYRDIFRSY